MVTNWYRVIICCPVKIAEVSQFEISAAKVVSPLAFRVMGHKLDRAGWTAEANTEELDR